MQLICRNKRKNSGLTMVEVLVSTLIAVMTVSALISIYVSVKNSYNNYKDKTTSESKELLVKNVFYDFVKDIGFACKFGYSGQTYYDRTSDSLDSFFYSPSMIRIGELPLTTSDQLPETLEDGCSGECYQTGTDYIMVKKELSHTSFAEINALSSTMNVNSVGDIAAGDYLFLCNKKYINLAKASTVDTDTNIIELSQAPLGAAYYPGDYIGKYSFEILYIRDTGQQDSEGQTIYSLYVYIKDNNAAGKSYELVRGVDNLQLEYATVDNNVITWNAITSDIDIDSSGYPAVKASFEVGGQTFSKVINL